MARVSKAKAIERLQGLVDEGRRVRPQDGHNQNFQKWSQGVDNAFYRIFGEHSRQYSQLPESYETTFQGILRYRDLVLSLVESNLDDVRLFWKDDDRQSLEHGTERKEKTIGVSQSDIEPNGIKVFVVHGRDESARETVARFLDRLRLDPIILHEKSNEGHTIIEKLVLNADVSFAVVLLTPDDVGGPAGNGDELRPRARQNVIFELGFFIGKLGRNRVCTFIKDTVETPSDYDGIVYTRMDDAGGWKTKLVQELKAAGFAIDANRAFRP